MKDIEINLEIRKAIVKGVVADFAHSKAQLENIDSKTLGIILEEIASQLK